jgi:hypothetical protein
MIEGNESEATGEVPTADFHIGSFSIADRFSTEVENKPN